MKKRIVSRIINYSLSLLLLMKKANHPIPVIIILGFCFISLVFNFHSQTLNMWDEATYANNAIDMMKNPSIVVKHKGEIDLYNTKPPLVITLQAIAMKVFGINTFAVRLPSIIFSICTVFLLYIYAQRWFKNPWIGLGSALILLATAGFIRNHIALTGDLDAALCFFLTAGFLHGTQLVMHKKTSLAPMLLFGVLLILGFYTKGIASFFHMPAIFVLALIYHPKVFAQIKLYLIAILVLGICGVYYYLREQAAPGYMQVVFDSEFSRVNNVVMNWQTRPFSFYIDNFINGDFTPWLYLFPLGLTLFYKPKTYGKIALALVIGIFFYFLLISYPKVKLDWYDAPLYPLLALFLGISLFHVLSILIKNKKIKERVYVVLILAIATPNFIEIIKTKLNTGQQIEALEYEGYFLDKIGKMKVSNKKITIYNKEQDKEHNDHVVFYERAMQELQYEIKYKVKPDFDLLETVLVSQDNLKQKMDSLYQYKVLLQDEVTGSELRLIKKRK